MLDVTFFDEPDVVAGLCHLTSEEPGSVGAGTVFCSPAEAQMAVDRGGLTLRSRIKVRLTDRRPPESVEAELFPDGWRHGQAWLAETTLGRVLFNELLPRDYPFLGERMPKERQVAIIDDVAAHYPMIVAAETADKLRAAGRHWAARSGVTVSTSDVPAPSEQTIGASPTASQYFASTHAVRHKLADKAFRMSGAGSEP
jgi:DNA-directed RNA polymerase subunit beta'